MSRRFGNRIFAPFALAAGLLWASPVLAQNFRIDSFVIAGGGGTSTNGNFSLTGTIGAIDAGKLSGGNFSIDGGFLAGVYLVQTPGAPVLSISRSGANAVISWNLDASTGFRLEESPAVNVPAAWSNSSDVLSTNGNQLSVTVPASSGLRFYRLHKP